MNASLKIKILFYTITKHNMHAKQGRQATTEVQMFVCLCDGTWWLFAYKKTWRLFRCGMHRY